jgi:hypothetical protein
MFTQLRTSLCVACIIPYLKSLLSGLIIKNHPEGAGAKWSSVEAVLRYIIPR